MVILVCCIACGVVSVLSSVTVCSIYKKSFVSQYYDNLKSCENLVIDRLFWDKMRAEERLNRFEEHGKAKTKKAGLVTFEDIARYVVDKEPIVRPVETVVLAAEDNDGVD